MSINAKTWRNLTIAGSAVLVALMAGFSTQIIEQVDANEIVVIQSLTGNLAVYTTAGPKLQLFGKVTAYPKRETYLFTADTRFNDGGAGTVDGSIDWIMPLATANIRLLHEQFGSADAVTENLVAVTTNKAIYMTGPLLSSTESYASRRTELIRWIEDQINGGIYQTTTTQIRETNQITGEEQTVTVASIREDENGVQLRQEEAYLASFGVVTANFAVRSIEYDARVQQQIDEQQANVMRVQTAQSEALSAEQRRITVEQQGLANAAQARAEQEVLKATAVTRAEQLLAVATLDEQTAGSERRANILRGQGEAERKRLVMSADGALTQKLAAYVTVNQAYAEMIGSYKGAWVPSVVTGGDGTDSAAGSGALQLLELLSVKAARDLALDMSNVGGRN